MAEGELRIKSNSIEKTTSAITALIGKLDQLDKSLDSVAKSTNDQAVSQNKSNTALKSAEIARKKAVEMLGLHKQGLGKLSDAYAEEQAAIKAREIAAKKNIELGSKEYQQLLDNVKATELASAASKRLAMEEAEKARELTRAEKAAKQAEQSTTKKTAAEIAAEKALNSSNISRETSIKLLKLEEKGLDRLSDEYAEQKGAILGAQQAKLKGIKVGTDEYNQLVKNTTAIEKSTAARKRLQAAEAKATKGASGFTDSLDDMAKQAALVDGPLGGISSRLTTLSTILKSTGLGGALALTALGVGVGVLSFKLRDGINAAADTEVSMKTLEAQLEQTGHAAGFTAEQLDRMSRKVAYSTLNSVEGVKSNITSLLAFTNISTGIFEETIRKVEDIAVLKKTGTVQITKQLGKVLENPVARYKQLAELGIDFEKSQIDSMEAARAQGDIQKEQRVILDAVAEKYKEIATAQADTLSGDVDTFNQKWGTYWEMMGKKGIPTLRSLVQGSTALVGILENITLTDLDKDMGAFEQEIDDTSRSVDDLQKQLGIVQELKDKLSSGNFELLPKDAAQDLKILAAEQQKLAFFKLLPFDVDYEPMMTKAQKLLQHYTDQEKQLEKVIKARTADQDQQRVKRSAEQQEAIEGIQEETASQKLLSELFIKYGDSRSADYIQAKANIDGLNKAKKEGLQYDEDAVALYQKEALAQARLTEAKVTHNTVLQKTKSLQSQQSGMEREIALYKATTSGILENSEAYIQLAASLKTANEIKQMGGEVSSKQAKALYQENLETLRLQKSISVLNALKANDPNSANVATLNRQISLQKAITQGIMKESREYIFLEEKLKAVNVATEGGIDVGSDEYKQLLLNAEGIAAKRAELQKYQDLASAGIVFNSTGQAQIEGSLKQLTSALPDELIKLDDLVDPDAGISQELIDQLKENLKLSFMDEKNSLLLPLGFFIDEENTMMLADEVNLAKEDLRLKQKELETAWREEDIQDAQLYAERYAQVTREGEEKIAQAKMDAWRKTAEYKNLILTQETANQVSAGIETLAVVAGNNKKLAKMAKLAATFSASASLVEALSEAASQEYPLNIPLYAKAFAQGTQLISMARGLNEPSFAFGGVDIQGAGTGRSDSIKANIARGESVMTAPATARYKDTLQRMNAGLPVRQGGGNSVSVPTSIIIQGDASERTVGLIEMKLRDYEDRVQQIAQGVSLETIQEENDVGGFLNPI